MGTWMSAWGRIIPALCAAGCLGGVETGGSARVGDALRTDGGATPLEIGDGVLFAVVSRPDVPTEHRGGGVLAFRREQGRFLGVLVLAKPGGIVNFAHVDQGFVDAMGLEASGGLALDADAFTQLASDADHRRQVFDGLLPGSDAATREYAALAYGEIAAATREGGDGGSGRSTDGLAGTIAATRAILRAAEISAWAWLMAQLQASFVLYSTLPVVIADFVWAPWPVLVGEVCGFVAALPIAVGAGAMCGYYLTPCVMAACTDSDLQESWDFVDESFGLRDPYNTNHRVRDIRCYRILPDGSRQEVCPSDTDEGTGIVCVAW